MTPEDPMTVTPPAPLTTPTWLGNLTETQQRWAGAILMVLICVFSFWVALNPALVLRLGHWGYLGAFVISLVASATIVLPAPGLAIIIAMSPSLNPVVLGIVAGVGSAFGELTGYAAGAGGSALIPIERQAQFERLRQLTQRYGAFILAALAALPFPLFDFAGIVAGAMRMRVVRFLVAVAIGKSIKYIILILLGASSIQWLQQLL
ncbi:MAG: VTT domain-containing protein [Caldilineaceae bacterium]|nr:VTT domain-containing protein [Caldilineaceae bacterium]